VRRHRWHGKILKARDPIVFSCGWRRFQSAPLYSLEDERQTRQRFLKYTPEHMHCGAHFKGFGVAPNTPLLGFHSLKSDCATFRVCLVGVVVKQETLSPVVKKLKLCGAPYRVEKNTAFIDGTDSASSCNFKVARSRRWRLHVALTPSTRRREPTLPRRSRRGRMRVSAAVTCLSTQVCSPPR